MAQEFKRAKIGIIGGGPAGCFCAYFLQENFDVTILEASSPLKTLLCTGGGRCNLAHNEVDFRELAKNYPRGEKFLYSIFSKFATTETLEVFKKMGIETYTQPDNRIFPTTNSAQDVREKFLNAIKKVKILKEKALRINQTSENLQVVTDCATHLFDRVVVATGGHSSYNLCKYLGHNIIEPKPALIGLKTDKNFPSGVVIKNVKTKLGKKILQEDLLFTHNGISGPLAFKISSLMAREPFPYNITLELLNNLNLQELLNQNPHKTLKNLIGEFVPKSFAQEICEENGETKCSQINAKIRDKILKNLQALELKVLAPSGAGEVVTCGGVDLKEINPKTMASKIDPRVYFCGEVIDIDGFCGGFNLQNCWSGAFVVANSILEDY